MYHNTWLTTSTPNTRWTFTNILLLEMAGTTAVSYAYPALGIYGMNGWFLGSHQYGSVAMQVVLYQLLHGGIVHLLGNSLFLYIFGNVLERKLGTDRYLLLFVGNTLFVAASLVLLTDSNTIGASGFAMAVLAYLGLDMWSRGDREYRAVIIFLLINIAIGLGPTVSLVGHAAGAVFGVLAFAGGWAWSRRGR